MYAYKKLIWSRKQINSLECMLADTKWIDLGMLKCIWPILTQYKYILIICRYSRTAYLLITRRYSSCYLKKSGRHSRTFLKTPHSSTSFTNTFKQNVLTSKVGRIEKRGHLLQRGIDYHAVRYQRERARNVRDVRRTRAGPRENCPQRGWSMGPPTACAGPKLGRRGPSFRLKPSYRPSTLRRPLPI